MYSAEIKKKKAWTIFVVLTIVFLIAEIALCAALQIGVWVETVSSWGATGFMFAAFACNRNKRAFLALITVGIFMNFFAYIMTIYIFLVYKLPDMGIYVFGLVLEVLLLLHAYGRIRGIVVPVAYGSLYVLRGVHSELNAIKDYIDNLGEHWQGFLMTTLGAMGWMLFGVSVVLFFLYKRNEISLERSLRVLKKQYEAGHVSLQEYDMRKEELLRKI